MKNSISISSDVSSKVLTIGPVHQNHRGGVGAVIEVYSRYYEKFKFITSHKPGTVLYRSKVFFLSLFKLVSVLLRDRKIRIVHIHGSSYGSFYRKFIYFVICKYLFRKKIIYHIHGGGFKVFYDKSDFVTRKLVRLFLAKSDIVICLSQSWREYFQQTFEIKKLMVLSNIIDYPEKIDVSDKQKELTFIFLGLVCNAKGIFDLIEVINKNKSAYRSKIKLLIGGNGEIQLLKDIIVKYEIADLVEYLGWITATGKAEVLNGSDIFILPSYKEGLPISILEAMSYSKAIIATNVGGIPEIVSDRVNGLLIEPGNQEQIERAINFFLENRDLLDSYGLASEQMVQKHLPHQVIKEVEHIYTSLLE